MAEKLTKIPRGRVHPRRTPADSAGAPDGQPTAPAEPDLSHITPGLRHLAVPVDKLKFHPKNPRKHGDKNLEAIRASLRVNGQYRPAVASTRTGELVVVVGNGMLAAALANGWAHLAVEPMKLTEERENQLAVTDNRTAELADWDQDCLKTIMLNLDTGEDDQLKAMMDQLSKDEGLVSSDPPPPSSPTAPTQWLVQVECADEAAQGALSDRLAAEGLKVKKVAS